MRSRKSLDLIDHCKFVFLSCLKFLEKGSFFLHKLFGNRVNICFHLVDLIDSMIIILLGVSVIDVHIIHHLVSGIHPVSFTKFVCILVAFQRVGSVLSILGPGMDSGYLSQFTNTVTKNDKYNIQIK